MSKPVASAETVVAVNRFRGANSKLYDMGSRSVRSGTVTNSARYFLGLPRPPSAYISAR